MKKLRIPRPLLALPLIAASAFSLVAPPLSHLALAAEGDIATNTVTGLNNVLGGINSFSGAYGASNAQLMGLVTQLSSMQNSVNGAQTQQGQLDQIAMQLQLAVIGPEGAQQCIQKATRTYEKFTKKNPKAADIQADKIATIEPTCTNYGLVLDALSVNDERISDTNKKMACLIKLQNTVSDLANKAKQPISQLMNSAGEVYKTHTQIIDAHKKIAEKLKNDLDGPDGKSGYRAQLGRLRSLSLELNNVLNAKKSEKKDLKYGLVKQVNDLQTMRATLGNDWYYALMADVEYCYSSAPAPCFDNDESMPPAQCVAALVKNEGVGKTGGGVRVRANTDTRGLMNLMRINAKSAQDKNLPANLDIAKPGEFLTFARKRFDATVGAMVSNFNNHQFSGSVDKTKIKSAITQGYNACWEQSVAKFNSDLASKGGNYYAKITAMKDAERETANDLKNWIDRVEGDMTQFRTAFHKVYNSELAQFKTDCTADEDPYKSLDCLRVISATLDSGIKGTRRAIKLGNGSQFTSFAGETVIPMQTLTLDAAGKPTIGSTNAACAGFDDCLNYLDRSKSDHDGAAQKGEDERSKFVQQHNTAVRSAFTVLSNQFGQMSQLFTQGVNAINGELAAFGVKGTLKTKDIKGEQLVENEKTGMIDMPKDMKAAMAGQAAFAEIDDTKEVSEAIRDLAKELSKKRTAATKMKNKCKIAKADYENLAGNMPKECSNTAEICRGDKIANAGTRMEDLFRRSALTIDDHERLTTLRDYEQCKRHVMSSARNVTAAEIRRAGRDGNHNIYSYSTSIDTATGKTTRKREKDDDAYDTARDEAVAQKEADAEDKARSECNGNVFSTLDGLAHKSRGQLKDQNSKLIQRLQDISDACNKVAKPAPSLRKTDDKGDDKEDDQQPNGRYATEDSDVTAACEEYKKAAKDAQPPEDEGETNVKKDGLSEPAKNPFSLPSFTAPAK